MQDYHLDKGLARAMLKVDILKAYDSIRWEFLWDVLDVMRFPWVFIRHNTRGLRKGDPLSPYLFIIGMDVLSSILKDKTTNLDFNYHWRCSKLKITHLCFADDLLLFANGDSKSCEVLIEALEEFRIISGLSPSPGKSATFLCGVLVVEAMRINRRVGF